MTSIFCLLILSTLAAISTTVQAQVVGLVPTSVNGAAYARSKTKFFVQGGIVVANGNTVAQQNQFFELDLAVPWTTMAPQWVSLKAGPTEAGHSAVVSSDDQSLVTFRSLPSSSTTQTSSSGSLSSSSSPLSYRYNIYGNNWDQSNVKVQYPSKEGITAIEDPTSGLVYMAGGYQSDDSQMYVYNIATDMMTMFPMPNNYMADRSFYEGVYVKNRRSILYFGGVPNNGQSSQNLISEFVPSSGMWSTFTAINSNPPHRIDHCMAVTDDGTKVIVFGGRLDNGNYASDLWILDVTTFTWSQGPSWTEPRASLTCTSAGSFFIAWGGTNGQRTASGAIILFDLNQLQFVSSYAPPASYIDINNKGIGSTNNDINGGNNNNNNGNNGYRNGNNNGYGRGSGYNPDLAAEFPDVEQSKSNAIAVIGGIIGSIFLVGAGAVLYVFWLRKRKRSSGRCISFDNGNNINNVHQYQSATNSFHTTSYQERGTMPRYSSSNSLYRIPTAPISNPTKVNKDGLTAEEEKELASH
ncbi:Multiple epidermal growth factor-like domains protein 8 [Gryganskiella cystojenkinii]|nr:Multiple epidermal growth factor-like domains protein 8 [Gryganskiella cystojenkinii]